MTFGSLFCGIAGFDLGFEKAGLRCSWQVEVDPVCSSVLAKHYPGIKRFADVRDCGKRNLSKVDVICGGFPCQDLSVAGKRKGITAARSGLFYEMTRIVDECRPAYLVWENVPGLLSNRDGKDFLAVFVELERIGYSGCWTTLDARFFGLAQRRRRVFGMFTRRRVGAVRCAQILALAARLPGHSAPCRQAQPDAAQDIAGCFNSGGNEGGFRTEPGEHLVARCDAPGHGHRNDADTETLIPFNWQEDDVSEKSYAPACGTQGELAIVTHSLCSEGADASEDGSGRGTPIIAVRTNQTGANGLNVSEDISPVLDSSQPVAIAFNVVSMAMEGKNHAYETDVSGCIQHKGLHPTGNEAGTVIAFQERTRQQGRTCEIQENLAYSLMAPTGGGRRQENNIATSLSVRRLTPRECERLQGFPDDWTRYNAEGKEIADGRRYHMLGNAVVPPISEWIGRRILAAEASS